MNVLRMKQCIKCYAENDDHVAICRACNSTKFIMEKESSMRCPACGAENEEGHDMCYSCGHRLDR
ncbi:double zinc ribbon domain-containing protein [Methanomassiliicoccus luminyensis]|uniref:double zinc ribbon domain-containing protein n=1 Tax=Methanomassiliicoccus luminyensis TaxID=1080712 RepID=UPI00036545F9|nr:zinc ribbon domain-containing protein [Methanomassiliicoccus luminyensis]